MFVRGDIDEYSDLDFVVIKNTGKRFIERLIEVAKLIDNNLGKVDVFVYTPVEFRMMIEGENVGGLKSNNFNNSHEEEIHIKTRTVSCFHALLYKD